MNTTLVPVEVSLVRTPDGRDRMVSKISLGHLMSNAPMMTDVDYKLSLFTEEYLTTLSRCKEELHHIEEEKRGKRGRVNPLRFWRIGDFLIAYLGGQPHQESFMLRDPYGHFARDLSVSKSTLQKAVTFRRRFDSPETIDTSKGWDYYREARYLQAGKTKPVTKTVPRETQGVVVTVRLAVPADVDAQWLRTQLRHWFCSADDSPVRPRWLENKGIKIKGYEISLPTNEPQPRAENGPLGNRKPPTEGVA